MILHSFYVWVLQVDRLMFFAHQKNGLPVICHCKYWHLRICHLICHGHVVTNDKSVAYCQVHKIHLSVANTHVSSITNVWLTYYSFSYHWSICQIGTLGSPVDINAENGTQTSPGEQNGQGPFSQLMDSIPWIASLFSGENSRVNGANQHAPASAEQVDGRNHGAPEVSGVSDEGLRFASLVRQIMPFISQVESHHQSASAVSSSTPSQVTAISSYYGCKYS